MHDTIVSDKKYQSYTQKFHNLTHNTITCRTHSNGILDVNEYATGPTCISNAIY